MRYAESTILTWLILLPALGAVLIMFIPASRQEMIRKVALAFCGGALALACIAATMLNWSLAGSYAGDIQLSQKMLWIAGLNAHYFVGADSLSMPLALLVCAIVFIACLAGFNQEKSPKSYFALLLLTLGGLLGVLFSLDLLLFYIFFQASIAPLFFLIGMWGGAKRDAAAIKFFLYTLVGSICLLIVVLGVDFQTRGVPGYPRGCLNMITLASNPRMLALFSPAGAAAAFAPAAFILLVVAFAIRAGAVPFHSWLPDAHVEAPTAVSMMLAGALLDTGAYGLLRIAYPLFPHEATRYWLLVAAAGVAGIFYGGLCAMAQRDFKRLVAYCSISQMGFVLLGIAVRDSTGFSGALFQMVALGISAAMMIFTVGIAADRAHHRDIGRLGGLAVNMPAYWGFSALTFLTAMGLPGLCGFIGETLVLFGAFEASRPGSALMKATAGHAFVPLVTLGALAALSIPLTAGYMIWTLQRVYLGPSKPENQHFAPLSGLEKLVLGPLAFAAIIFGIFPGALLLTPVRPTVRAMLGGARAAATARPRR